MPDPTMVQWMAKQIEPYVQTLVTNKKIRDIQNEISAIKKDALWQPIYKNPDELISLYQSKINKLMSIPKVTFPAVMDNPEGIMIRKVPQNIIPENLRKLMRTSGIKHIQLVMQYRLPIAAGNYYRDYDENGIAVVVDLLKIARSDDPDRRAIELLSHELTHNIQHLMSKAGYNYGHPSKSIATPEYNVEEYAESSPDMSKEELNVYHSLLDTEFYPRLTNIAVSLKHLKESNPNADIGWFKNFINQSAWLNILKEHAIDKYHKAVNELLKVFQTN